MAKTSKIAKNNQRKKAISFYSERRQELLKIIKDPNTSYDEKREAQKRLQKCLEMHLLQDIEIDVKLQVGLEEHSGNLVCQETLLETLH